MTRIWTSATLSLLLVLAHPALMASEQHSGFLEDYSGLEPDTEREGAMIWIKDGADLSAFDKIAIDAIEIWYAPDAEHKGIDPDKLKVFTDKFREKITEAMEPEFPVVSKAGPGVLVLRLAVTNLRTRKMGIRLYHIGISGIAMKAAEEATGKSLLVDEAVLEAELVDGATGERIVALIDQVPQLSKEDLEKGKKVGEDRGLAGQLLPGSEPSWNKVTATLEAYAKRLREHMDAAHGS